MVDAQEIIKRADRLRTLTRQVLGSGSGKELLEELERVYVQGKLYQETDRATIYAVAQRDFILELKAMVDNDLGDPKPDGEETNE